MAYTQNESIDGLTAITPTTDDIVVTMDQAEIGVAKTSTLLSIYNLFKTTYDTVYAKYLGDADFYKYSIVTSVASGNLTVALKNYEGNDPTPTKPIKIQIGGVVRTITSGIYMTTTLNAGINHMNAGSAELATKEVDLFTYLQYNTTTSAVNILASRIPYAVFMSDFTNSATEEKGVLGIINYNSTNSVVNIGRFNAILSAGGAYTWSLPATSIIINSPIYETRSLDYNPTITWNGTVPTGLIASSFKYRVVYDNVEINNYTGYSSAGTSNTNVQITLPFSVKHKQSISSIITAGTTPGATYCDLSTSSNTATIYTSTLAYVDRFGMNGNYNI